MIGSARPCGAFWRAAAVDGSRSGNGSSASASSSSRKSWSTARPSIEEPFSADGGFARLNKVFGGKLETVLADINEEMWKKAADDCNGNGTTRDIVAKLWNLCHVLRDDGVTYNEYVTELTFLLFLKMLAETGHEDAPAERLPLGRTGQARRASISWTITGACCSISATGRARTKLVRRFSPMRRPSCASRPTSRR